MFCPGWPQWSIQSDNELDFDFEEDEKEDKEVDEEEKGQISASCFFFCCILSFGESSFYNLYRNVYFLYV